MSRLERFSTITVLAVLGFLAWSAGAQGQERNVVANQVEVSRSDASLYLEFSDGERLTVSFEDGTARVDGEILGTYEVGGDADQAWRALLADVLSLSNGALARALERWQPDPDADPEELPLLQALDGALDDAVARAAGRDREDRTEAKERLTDLLQVLARSEYVEGLGEALENTDLDGIQIWLNEDHVVRRDEVVEGSVLLVDGELEVRGRVTGDVIVLDGRFTLRDGGSVDGDVRLIGSDEADVDGEVRGIVVDVTRELRRERSRIRDEIRSELREEFRRSSRSDRSSGVMSRAARAVGSVFESLLSFALLAVLALMVTRFGGERVKTVTHAVRDNPARSAAVGFAGAFLVVPVYILGLLVLTVSIVGIPALLIWAPLFPLAVALGAFIGYVGVSHHVGRWILSHDFHWLDWVDEHSDTHVKLVGLAALLAPFAVASVLQVVPFVGWMGGLISALGSLACLAALMMGFGAVITTRGGRFSNYDFDLDVDLDANWSPTSEVDMDPLESEDVERVVDAEVAEDGGDEGGSDS